MRGATAAVEYDAVILATGFRHGLADFVRGHEALLSGGGGERPPMLAAGGRSAILPSIFFVGMDQFQSTLSIGPVLGYRGYDVGVAVAEELYGPAPPAPAPVPAPTPVPAPEPA